MSNTLHCNIDKISNNLEMAQHHFQPYGTPVWWIDYLHIVRLRMIAEHKKPCSDATIFVKPYVIADSKGVYVIDDATSVFHVPCGSRSIRETVRGGFVILSYESPTGVFTSMSAPVKKPMLGGLDFFAMFCADTEKNAEYRLANDMSLRPTDVQWPDHVALIGQRPQTITSPPVSPLPQDLLCK